MVGNTQHMAVLEAFHAFEQQTTSYALSLVQAYGGWGVLVGMFLESSIIPVPSELILVGAGSLGISPITVAIYGGIGSTLGAIVGYYIRKWGGRPVVDKYGKYLLLTPKRVEKAEAEVKRHGPVFVLFARLVPLIPFKVFSIASGILKVDLPQFAIYTLLGTLVRAYMLASVGLAILQYQEKALYVIAALAVLGVLLYYGNRKYKWRKRIAAKLMGNKKSA